MSAGCDPRMQIPVAPTGVSTCYVFKSRLQEYAQKVGLPTPTYETIREGPSHEPFFRSTVIIGGVRYDSLPGFTNRKAAEQSAAEVALMELSMSGEKKESIAAPVHETGLCKNLLQEYAQKMNFAIPTYTCRKVDSAARTPHFSCIVEIGEIQYIGATARTKREAEIKAARTALLAIQSSGRVGGELGSKTQYSVVPCKRKVPDAALPQVATVKAKKQKKPKNKRRKKHPGFSGDQIQAGNMVDGSMGMQSSAQQSQERLAGIQAVYNGQTFQSLASSAPVIGYTYMNQLNGKVHAGEGNSGSQVTVNGNDAQSIASNSRQDSVVKALQADSLALMQEAIGDTPIINAPASVLSDALLLDSGNDHGVDNIAFMTNAPGMADTSHARQKSNTDTAGGSETAATPC